MTHPFAKMFEAALKKVRDDDFENRVLEVAEGLLDKGYRYAEIKDVLDKFSKGRVDVKDERIAKEAVEEFSRHEVDSRAD